MGNIMVLKIKHSIMKRKNHVGKSIDKKKKNGRVFPLSPPLLVCIFQGRHSICVIYMKRLDVRSLFHSYKDFLTGILCPVRSLGRVFPLSPPLLVCIFQGRHPIWVIYMKKLDVRSLFHSYNDFLTGILCPVCNRFLCCVNRVQTNVSIVF